MGVRLFDVVRIWCSLPSVSLDSLAALLLALAIEFAPPGRSPHSVVEVTACGKEVQRCHVGPPCDEPVLACRAPRWSPRRNAWFRLEQPEEGVDRYRRIVAAMAKTAQRFVANASEETSDFSWPGSEEELALSALTVALHESGLRRDVQFGEEPLGRGSLGEACLLQLHVHQAPRFAPWLSEEERGAMTKTPQAREAFARTLLGDSPRALRRCVEIGMRMLVRARAACNAGGGDWAHGMFSMYGSGTSCRVSALANRARTFRALKARAHRWKHRKASSSQNES